MFNLIVEPTKPEVCPWVRSDVSGREDLTSELIQLMVRPQNEHSLMIGRKHGAHIEPPQHLMHQDEGYCLPDAQESEHDTKVDSKVSGHEQPFDDGKPGAPGQQKSDTVDANREAL